MLKQKLIALILTLTMMGTYLITLGNVAIAVSDELAGQNSKTNNSNIEFNSYFEGGEHSKIFEIGKEAKMYLEVKVSDVGYLKNTVVQFSNANFEIDTEKLDNSNIQSSSKEKIKLKQINNSANSTIIEVPVIMKNGEEIENDFFSKTSKVTFTATYIDENGKEHSVEKEINNELIWQGEAELNLSGNLNKIKLYEVNEEKGVLLQAIIKSGIKDNTLPIAKTKLEVSMPEFKITNESGEEKIVVPTRATVVANSTKGTNGKGSTEFTEANYTYNAETNKIEINVENAEQDGKISWAKSAEDEYVVTYVYAGEEIYNYISEQLEKAEETIKTEEQIKAGEVNENAITGEIEVTANVEVYGAKEPEISKTEKIEYSFEKQNGEILETSINSTESISKGYIYANYAKETKEENEEPKKDTSFDVNYTVQVYDKSLTDGITLKTVAEKYIDEDEEEYNSKVNNKETIYSKFVKIEKEIFDKMLGEEGKIEITDKEGEKIAEITKDTENLTANIEEAEVNEIIIKTTKPITEGKITILVEKAILAEQGYSKENMQDFRKITLGVISETEKTTEIELAEPITKAEISIDTENLSTVVENEDVEIRVLLDTSDNGNALYKDPTLQIVLPKNIEKIDINSTDILLDDELKIKESKVYEQDGRKGILVTLDGTQTKYTDNGTADNQNIIAKGTNIVIKADITFEKFAPSANENILLYYINKNSDLYEKSIQTNSGNDKVGLAITDVEVVSPNGVVTESHMNGYNGSNAISSLETEKQEATIKVKDSEKEVTIGGTIVNNYANDIENISILGRLPFAGNTQIDGTEELESNFNMSMEEKIIVDGIDKSKAKIYYTTNGQATKDLELEENAWTEEPTDLTQIKSYLIVLNEKLATGAQFNFDYKVELPKDLDYNNSSYTTYKVYYDNKMEDATLNETKVAGTIGLTTGEAPDISVELNSTIDTVREGQIVKMKATVKNDGENVVENVKVNIPLPENTVFMEYSTGNGFAKDDEDEKVITIGELKAGESEQIIYYLKFDENISSSVSDGEPVFPKEIIHRINATADDIENEVPSNDCKFSVEDGQIVLQLVPQTDDAQVLTEGQLINYMINLKNISGKGDLNNTVVTVPLPQGIKYVSGEIRDSWSAENATTEGITYDESNNTVSINIGTLSIQKIILLDVQVEKVTGNISIMAKAKADGTEEQYSNVTEFMTEVIGLEISELTSTPKYLKEGDNVTYTLTLKNNGNTIITGIRLSSVLPEELTFIEANYTYNGKEEKVTTLKNGRVEFLINQLLPGESTTVKIIAKAGILPSTDDKEIKNSMTVVANNFESKKTNEVTNIIEYYQPVHDQTQDDNKPSTNRYKITGTAWLDENKDGIRTDDEQILSGIQVMLINKADSELVTDVDTGEQKIVNTDDKGQYEFSNLTSGQYLVVFMYDAGKYNITEYQADSADASYNSDAISMKIVLNGEQRYAGVTDTIRISGSNARDIDIGLYIAEKFDLRLDKYISKITLTTPSAGKKVYYYENSQLTKRDFYEKDINNSTMIVEYRIVVTNEGQVPGYVRKIIDYLPEDVKFSSELNKDWYISNDNGVVYNTALENEKIEPGQSKEVTLVLSLNITDKNMGTVINNNAEIYESYNDQGIKDYDSIEANKLETEDDFSNADIMISLATGNIVLYTTFALAILVLLGFGIYEIKKRVLDKKNN